MFDLSFENPYIYIDCFGDKYTFYIFTDVRGGKNFSIRVEYLDSKKTIPIFGYEVLGTGFALPLDGENILWDAYEKVKDAGPRGKCMSAEARKMADKIFKLKAFL